MAIKNSNKRQFIVSIMSLTLSVTMLMGATLAWFTDSSTTKVNTIQAGNLDIEFMMKNDNGNWVTAEGETLEFQTNENNLLEPGAKFALPELQVKNNGNLSLKFKLVINGSKDNKLAEAIDIYLGDENLGSLSSFMNKNNEIVSGKLLSQESNTYKFNFKMRENVGNEFKNETLSDISFTVFATQDTYEKDSFENDYDKDAEYSIPVSTSSDFEQAIANGAKAVSLTENISLENTLCVENELTINGNGRTLTSNGGPVIKVENDNSKIVLSNITLGDSKTRASRDRIINVNGVNGADIVLDNVDLINPNGERALSIFNSKDINVNINNSEIISKNYTLNVASNCSNVKMNVSNSKIKGWAAFQSWSNNVEANFNNCELIGDNYVEVTGLANYFSTIVLNQQVTENKLNFNNCTIQANYIGETQTHYCDRNGSNDINFNNCKYFVNGTEVDEPTTF